MHRLKRATAIPCAARLASVRFRPRRGYKESFRGAPGLLDQQGIQGWVFGDTLQGGVGELPAGALVRVVVNTEDLQRARQVIRDWESATPETGSNDDTPAFSMHRERSQLGSFILGALVGAALTLIFLSA